MKKSKIVISVMLVILAVLSFATIACDKKVNQYTVTIAAYDESRGTVTLSPEVEGNKYDEGTNVTITVTAKGDYEIDKVTVAGKDVTLNGGKYTFEITADTTVKATFKEKGEEPPVTNKYTVTTEYIESQGKVELSPAATDNKYDKGTEITITVTAEEGYEVDKVTAGEKELTATDGKYKFKVEEDTTVKVTFKEKISDNPIDPYQIETHCAFWNVWEGSAEDKTAYKLEITDTGMMFYINGAGQIIDDALVTFEDGKDSEIEFYVGDDTYVIYLQRTTLKLCKDDIDNVIADLISEGSVEKPYEWDAFDGDHEITLRYQDDVFLNYTYYAFTQTENKIYSVSYPQEFQNLLFKLYEENNENYPEANWSNFKGDGQTKGAVDFQLLAGKRYILRLDGVSVGKNNKFTLSVSTKTLSIGSDYIGTWQPLEEESDAPVSKVTIDANGVKIFTSDDDTQYSEIALADILLSRGGTGYYFNWSENITSISVVVDGDSTNNALCLMFSYTDEGGEHEYRFYHPDNFPTYAEGSVKNPIVLSEEEFVKEWSLKISQEQFYSFTPTETSTYTITKGGENVYIEFTLDGEKVFSFNSEFDEEVVIKLEQGKTYIIILNDQAEFGGTTLTFTITEGGEYTGPVQVEIPEEIRNIKWQPNGNKTVKVNQYDIDANTTGAFNWTWTVVNIENSADKTVISARHDNSNATFTYDPNAKTLTFDNGNGTTVVWLAEGASGVEDEPLDSVDSKFIGSWATETKNYAVTITSDGMTAFTDDGDAEAELSNITYYENRITFTSTIILLGNPCSTEYELRYEDGKLALYYAGGDAVNDNTVLTRENGPDVPPADVDIPQEFVGKWKEVESEDAMNMSFEITENSVKLFIYGLEQTDLGSISVTDNEIIFNYDGSEYTLKLNDNTLELRVDGALFTSFVRDGGDVPPADVDYPEEFIGKYSGEERYPAKSWKIEITADTISVTIDDTLCSVLILSYEENSGLINKKQITITVDGTEYSLVFLASGYPSIEWKYDDLVVEDAEGTEVVVLARESEPEVPPSSNVPDKYVGEWKFVSRTGYEYISDCKVVITEEKLDSITFNKYECTYDKDAVSFSEEKITLTFSLNLDLGEYDVTITVSDETMTLDAQSRSGNYSFVVTLEPKKELGPDSQLPAPVQLPENFTKYAGTYSEDASKEGIYTSYKIVINEDGNVTLELDGQSYNAVVTRTEGTDTIYILVEGVEEEIKLVMFLSYYGDFLRMYAYTNSTFVTLMKEGSEDWGDWEWDY